MAIYKAIYMQNKTINTIVIWYRLNWLSINDPGGDVGVVMFPVRCFQYHFFWNAVFSKEIAD